MKNRFLLSTCFIAVTAMLPFANAGEKSADQWAVDLGSDSPEVRQQASAGLMALGAEAEAVLTRLAASSDPWLSARATRLLMELRGIDPRLPLHLQLAVLGFGALDEEQRVELINELSKAGPGHLNGLAFVFSRAATDENLTDDEARVWERRFSSCIAANRNDTGTLRLDALSPATLAILLSAFPDRLGEENSARYREWLGRDEELRVHLLANTVDLEVFRLNEQGSATEMLEFLPRVVDQRARAHAADSIGKLVLKDADFNAGHLSEKASIGHLMALMGGSGFSQAQHWYEKHVARHPGMVDALPVELEILEVKRLLEAKRIPEAISLALKPGGGSGGPAPTGRNLLREIGLSLGIKAEQLPGGFPAIPDPQSFPWMSQLIGDWFPMSRPAPGYSDIDAKVECFDRWATTDEWLVAVRRFGPQPLYHLVMQRRGKLDKAMLAHEFERETAALKNLGKLILMRPGIGRELHASRCSVTTLRDILDGALEGFGLISPPPWPVVELAAEWEKFYPELLNEGAFRSRPLYQAVRIWNDGGRSEASASLISLTRPIPFDVLPGQVRAATESPNPLAGAATCLLADLLGKNPDADVAALLPGDTVNREMLERIFDRLNRKEDRSHAQVRCAMAVAGLLRDRFGVDDSKPLLSSHEARSMARDAWMAGDDRLAAEFLTNAFLSDLDPEEHYDGIFVPVLMLLGRAEDALEKLDAARTRMPREVHQTKRARLLHALGRSSEAMNTVSPDHHPEFRMNLAIESGDWEAAIRSAFKVESSDRKKREAIVAGMALLSGDPALMRRHIVRDHPVISLFQGNALRDDDLADMARDAELTSRREVLLTNSLAAGAPVPMRLMSEYFRYLDLLPDRPRAIRLARDLAQAERCEINGRSDAEGCDAMHKVIAAEALLLLGRSDLAFEAMRPLMQASVAPHELKSATRWSPGGHTKSLVAACRQIRRIADMEWPDDTPEARMDHLEKIINQAEALERGRDLLELIFEHETDLGKTELLEALWFPFRDLAQSGEVPEDLTDAAIALEKKRELDEKESDRLRALWLPVSWQRESSHPPVTGKAVTKVSFTPKAGAHSDPKKAGFVIMDGLSTAAKLQKKDETEPARELVRDVVIRLLLDSDLIRQEVDWRVITRRGSGTHSKSFSTRGLETALFAFEALGFSFDSTCSVISACTDSWTNYSDKRRLLHAARIYERGGEHAAALSCYLRYLVVTVPAVDSRDTGIAGRGEIAEMQRVRGIVAANECDSERAVNAILRMLQLAPYEPGLAAGTVEVLKRNADQKALDSARQLVEGFWKTRLIEIPSSRTYQYWKEQWEAVLP